VPAPKSSDLPELDDEIYRAAARVAAVCIREVQREGAALADRLGATPGATAVGIADKALDYLAIECQRLIEQYYSVRRNVGASDRTIESELGNLMGLTRTGVRLAFGRESKRLAAFRQRITQLSSGPRGPQSPRAS
jgi:hypothetical protein